MSRLTLERMQELLGIHGEYERRNDIDGVMSTLVDNPIFEFHPQNIRVQGRTAVREMYTRLCNTILPHFATDNQARKTGSADQFGSKGSLMFALAADTTGKFLPDDESRMFFELDIAYSPHRGPAARHRIFQIVTFRGELMVGERTYTDADCAALFDAALGVDFFLLPGVGKSTPDRALRG
jgi:hypothetical protein